VFLPGWEEGIFPNQRSLDESGDKGLEEERRLAYVGLTRARRRAIISHAANRRIYANWQSSIPSRFLNELPDAEVERTGSGDYRREARLAAATAFSGGAFPIVARPVRVIEAWEQPGRAARADQVKVGARVFHQKFGYGTVKAADDDRLDIAFDKAGEKRVLDRYVEVAADP
jgi:DNA helicase-2/ATP-dependent DNA helicase PcrA